mmetsp:Transcript_34565/g.35241  ORF Transcript_34565/g.35241 Transcript_34565/m.35241 type:complete len:96 (-) Transcript_34565:26-313(-)
MPPVVSAFASFTLTSTLFQRGARSLSMSNPSNLFALTILKADFFTYMGLNAKAALSATRVTTENNNELNIFSKRYRKVLRMIERQIISLPQIAKK